MATTLNISLEEEQKGWLNARREAGGFASASDVVRALIREAQERDQAILLKRLKAMETDGSTKPEPEAAVLSIVQRVKRERRA